MGDQNIRIYDGDIIKIKKSNNQILEQISKAIKSNLNPRLIAVFISGRVEQTGKTTISRGSSLNDALELAGGPKFVRGRVIFTRCVAILPAVSVSFMSMNSLLIM